MESNAWLYKNEPVELLTVRWLTISLKLTYTVKSSVKQVFVAKTNRPLNRLLQEVLYKYV